MNLYEIASDDILSIAFTVPDAWETAYIRHGLRPAHLALPKHQRAFQAIVELRQERKPLDDVLILAKCGSAVTPEDLGRWAEASDKLLAQSFTDKIALVKEYGLTRGTHQLLQVAGQQLTEGKPRKQVAANLITTLSHLETSGGNTQDATATAQADELDKLFGSPPPPALWTGLEWFDRSFGGIGKAQFWGLAAPYKSRKTTTLVNLTVGAIMGAHANQKPMPSLAFMSGEMLSYEISAWIIAMLTAAILVKSGDCNTPVPGKNITYGTVSGDMLIRSGYNYRHWNPRTAEAIDTARKAFREIFSQHLRIYDKRRDHGAILTFDDVKTAFLKDKFLYQTELCLVDYLQTFSTGEGQDEEYHRARKGSQFFVDLVKTEGVSFFVAAQQNEAGVKDSTGYSPQVSGGGAFAKAIEYLIENWYKRDGMPDNQLLWRLKLGRHSGNSETTVDIHPPTGLVLNNTWVKEWHL